MSLNFCEAQTGDSYYRRVSAVFRDGDERGTLPADRRQRLADALEGNDPKAFG